MLCGRGALCLACLLLGQFGGAGAKGANILRCRCCGGQGNTTACAGRTTRNVSTTVAPPSGTAQSAPPSQGTPQQPAALNVGVPADQRSRLRITNGCPSEPMWVAHMAGAGEAHPQDIKLSPGAFFDFDIRDGLASTRYWPKFGCDSNGVCRVGSSGGPGQACGPLGCAPPVDSKFEATFGVVGAPCDPQHGAGSGCDWLDISMVDGFTAPFEVSVSGCGGKGGVNCSSLSFGSCPVEQTPLGLVDLRVLDPASGQPVGCYSPCGKLTYSNWGNLLGLHSPTHEAASLYCCPTPPISVQACQTGPVSTSGYVSMVHRDCPNVYGYAYDDAVGLSMCPAGAQYHVTFRCPA